MLEEICREINNYFDTNRYFGSFEIVNGKLAPNTSFSLKDGQYFRVIGSTFNDGVYQYGSEELTDESFDGSIWAMAVPSAVTALVNEVETWTKNNAKLLESPYQNESFGGYSYSLKSGNGGKAITWQTQFSEKLKKWRKICPY